VGWEAYDRYQQGSPDMEAALKQQLACFLDPTRSYAVRSSANIEDSREHSFAGQFKTVLGAQGVPAVFDGIRSIWATANSPGVRAYIDKFAGPSRPVRMAVIVQEMVSPVVSGVAFSRNPITGEDEVIVEAVQGAGTALVQDGVTPLRWVHGEGQWKSQPPDSPILPGLIEKVIAQTRHIARLFRMDVDLEWVFDGQDLYWLQIREVTSLKDMIVYSNRIAREVLPGMIKPLVWSVNIPLINSVWVEVFTELVGKNDLKFDDLARSFYFRAYFNLSALGRIWGALGMPRESLEMMMGVLPRPEQGVRFKPTWRTLRLTPRLLVFIYKKLGLGKRFAQEYPRLATRFTTYDWRNTHHHDERALLVEIDRLYADLHKLVYYNINIPLLMGIYTKLVGRYLKKVGADLSQFDLMEGMREHLEYAPDISLRELQEQFAAFDPDLQERVARASFAEFSTLPGIAEFQQNVYTFLDRFGHLSDSGNDFSAIPWRETPEIVLALVAQGAAGDKTVQPLGSFQSLVLSGVDKLWGNWFYQRARLFRLYREQISSLYTYAYGLFRPYYLALGSQMAARGWLFEPGDIFYLERNEIQELVDSEGKMADDYAALARIRKTEMQNCQNVQLPALIYGEAAPVVGEQVEEKLNGVPTSRGFYSGPVRVVCGIEDFKKVQVGDVLVIPYSDVGWTPLFARAGAVVAESGGILSHSSIIAREYRIPAVVSVAGAMRLRDEQVVTVDGYRGDVILHD
jgi:phosphohistidine swiveling domain-containing protein